MNSFSTYIHRESFVHRLNPSLKFMCGILMIVMVFLPLGFFGQVVIFAIVMTLWFASKLRWRIMKGIIGSVIFMFVMILVINWISVKSPSFILGDDVNFLFMHKGDWGMMNCVISKITGPGQIYQSHNFIYSPIWGGDIVTNSVFLQKPADNPNPIYHNYSYVQIMVSGLDGQIGAVPVYLYYTKAWYTMSVSVIFNSLYITIKIFLMIVIVTLVISTTTPVQLTFAIEDILSPFGYLKLPVNEWSMTISIAIRFVPSLIAESQKILKAQASRGVDFSYGKIQDKLKSLVSLVVPMFSVAFHKADDLANAMEARSYNPRFSRTRYRSYPIKWNEWFLFIFLGFVLGIMIVSAAKHCVFAPFSWVEAITVCG